MCRAKIVYPACLWNLDSKNEINIETKLVLPVLVHRDYSKVCCKKIKQDFKTLKTCEELGDI